MINLERLCRLMVGTMRILMRDPTLEVSDHTVAFADAGLDSFSSMLLMMYVSDWYGIDDETVKTFTGKTLAEFMAWVNQVAKKEPDASDDVLLKEVS